MTTSAPPRFTCFVHGFPRTKGSLRAIHRKRADGNCFVSLVEDNGFELQQWRTFIATESKRVMKQEAPFAGPLRVGLTFIFPRPKTQTPEDKACPWVYGNRRHDLDKLTRACLDSMTDAAVWEDDSQVAMSLCEKRYMEGDERAGVLITVEALT